MTFGSQSANESVTATLGFGSSRVRVERRWCSLAGEIPEKVLRIAAFKP